MADSQIEIHQCPDCQHRQEVTVWKTLDVTLDPGLRDRLFKGEINGFTCRKCGMAGRIKSSLLYHDMARQFCVQYYPSEVIDKDDFLTNFTPDGNVIVKGIPSNGDSYQLNPHVVFDLRELVRYVRFRERLCEVWEKE
jgi:hypothetical protein